MAELGEVLVEACATIRECDVWCDASWAAIVRLAAPVAADDGGGETSVNLEPYTPAVLRAVKRASDLPDWGTTRPSILDYLDLACRLFPTSDVVVRIAEIYLDAGLTQRGVAALRQAVIHAGAWPATWILYARLVYCEEAPTDCERVIRGGLDRVGLDPHAGPLWEMLTRILVAKALQHPDDANAVSVAREAVYAACAAPLELDDSRDNLLLKRLAALEEAATHGTDVRPRDKLPNSVAEAHRIARHISASSTTAQRPNDMWFPSPRITDASVRRWSRWMAVLKERLCDSLQLINPGVRRRYVALCVDQMQHQFCRQALPYILSLNHTGAAPAAVGLQYVLSPQGRLLLDAAVAAQSSETEEKVPFPNDEECAATWLAKLKRARDRLLEIPGDEEPRRKEARRLLRDIGKRAVAARVPYYEFYDEWATAELTTLRDATLILDISRRSIGLAEAAARGRTVPRAGMNLIELGLATARWADIRCDETDIKASVQRAVQLSAAGAAAGATDGSSREAWMRFAETEYDARGASASDDVVRRFSQTLVPADADGEVGPAIAVGATSWGLASLGHTVQRFLPTCGNHVCLSADEQSVYPVLLDAEQAVLNVLSDKEKWFADPERSQLQPHASLATPDETRITRVDFSRWRALKAPPHNSNPSSILEEQNSDELCAPRSMKPALPMIADPSATARRLWVAIQSATPEAELFTAQAPRAASEDPSHPSAGGSAHSRELRLPYQLQMLVDVCCGLPPPSSNKGISVEWLEKQLKPPLDLHYIPPRAALKKKR